jgi:hypothetical protein
VKPLLKPGQSMKARFVADLVLSGPDDVYRVLGTIPTLVLGDVVDVVRFTVSEKAGRLLGAPAGSTTLALHCPRCRQRDYLGLDYDRAENGARWEVLSTDPLTLDKSVLYESPSRRDGGVDRCHYALKDGLFVLHGDSTPG